MSGLFSGMLRTSTHLIRYRHIIAVLLKYGFAEAAGMIAKKFKIRIFPKSVTSGLREKMRTTSTEQRLRMAMEEMGPTFIKLGQLLSTRPDLLPEEYIEEFEKLQDQVSAEKYETIRAVIKEQLGRYPEELFQSFDPVPLAAASIAQVHRAKTRDGKEVVVKVRRPDIEKTILTELEILEDLTGLMINRIEALKTFDPERMVREFTQAVNKEVDFNNERRNQKRFLLHFADEATVHVPEVYDEYCSNGILTMEYIDGIKPDSPDKLKSAELDPKVIAEHGADFVLKQIFDIGLFHADPHPGNFFVIENNVLAPFDFGQVGRLTRQDRNLLQYIVVAIANDDVTRIILRLEQAEILEETTNIIELTRDIEDILDTYSDLPLKEIPFREAFGRGLEILRRHQIHPPRDFSIMLKSLMTIESFANKLDENFNIVDHLKSYAKKYAYREVSPSKLADDAIHTVQGTRDLISRFPDDAIAIINKLRRGNLNIHIHHEHLEKLEKTLNNSSNRLSFSITIAGLLIGSSLLILQKGNVMGLFSLEHLGVTGYIIAAVLGIWLLISIIHSRKL